MWKKIVGGLVVALLLILLGILATLTFRRPAIAPPSNVRVERTPDRIARGKYLFDAVSSCWDCHSVLDETRFGFPVAPGGRGKGKVMPEAMGLPGTIVASNLTPDPDSGLGNWTDGEIIRAIREGIGRDRRALFPLMPYTEYRYMSDDDVHSVVAYLRSLPPVSNSLPKTKIDFPVNHLIKGAPQPTGSVPHPNPADPVAYGNYLARIAGCRFCHTPVENDQPIPGREFAGGHEFPINRDIKVISANLTPDPETGIGRWTEQQFLDKFYQYKDYIENGPPKVELREQTLMPWLGLAKLTPEDLRAIFVYLKTVPALHNAVETKPSASEKEGS